MKVFLSWSGDKSHKVALVFRDWFPSYVAQQNSPTHAQKNYPFNLKIY